MESIVDGKRYLTSNSIDKHWISGEQVSMYFRESCELLEVKIKDIVSSNHVLYATQNGNYFLLLRYSLFGIGNKIIPVESDHVKHFLEINQNERQLFGTSKDSKEWLKKYFLSEEA